MSPTSSSQAYKGPFWSWISQAQSFLKRATLRMHAPDYYALNPRDADQIREKAVRFADFYVSGLDEKPTYDVYEVIYVYPGDWKFVHYGILISGRLLHLKWRYDDGGNINGVTVLKDPFGNNGPYPVHRINYIGKTHYPPFVAWKIGLILTLLTNEKHNL